MPGTTTFNSEDVQLLEKAISSAIINVIATTSGFELNSSEVVLQGNSLQESQIVGLMFLPGNVNALLSITMSNNTASTIVSYMTGIERADLNEEDVQDGVSELVNMIAGSSKSLLKDSKYYFNLTSPLTIVGENRFMTHKGNGNKLYKRFYFGEMEINVIYIIL